MIGRVLKVMIIICCVLALCSFAPKTQMYENKDLHIGDNYIKETLITVAEEENESDQSNDIRDSVEEKHEDGQMKFTAAGYFEAVCVVCFFNTKADICI